MSSWSVMALLSLGRLRFCAVTLDKATNRASYSIGLSVNRPPGKKNLPSRNSRGAGGRKPRLEVGEPRTQKMPVDQDWTAVYPAATSFRATSVPLPLRMGYPVKGGVPPDKTGNLELIKIPNFLHLTPIAIRKHCEALKAFCTQWPSSLDTEEACDEHFPIKVESTDYVSAGLSVRNPAARVVHLRVKLSSLNLDDHARKKMLKLVGERYCKKKDILAITTDSCPLRQQNYDYAMYLLTVLYHESWKTESWEGEKTVADMEEYSWEDSPSQKNIVDLLLRMEAAGEEEEDKVRERLLERSDVQEYKDSVVRLKNEGDSESNMLQYKEAVKKVFSL